MHEISRDLTPRQIVVELDKYIIGQKNAKRNVAIAMRNRWRRMHAKAEMQQDIIPNNILLIGSTGVGKTEIARRLAKIVNAPFTKVEASKFTEVGYVGRDVESMIRDLVEQSINMVKVAKKKDVREKAYQIAEDKILDILIPPLKVKKSQTVSSSEVPQNDVELNERTREQFREKIKKGDLDDRKIEILLEHGQNGSINMIGGNIDDTALINLQEMIGGMMPTKKRKRAVTVQEAKRILVEEECAKMIDMDEVKEEAIFKAANSGIVFIDELDKIASSSVGNIGKSPDVSREGVQRDLLPIVEGSSVNTKYGIINTDHILFIAAGAFHFTKPSDLIPELQGRFPIRVELDNLTEKDFFQILTEPRNALTKQYQALTDAENVQLSFEEDAMKEIAKMAFKINEEVENIGARRLHTVMSKLLNEILFDIPDTITSGALVNINRDMVKTKLNNLVSNKDLNKYIL